MRKTDRRWLWLLVPLLGISVTLALPPLDEYASLDRIGKRYDPLEDLMIPISPNASASVRARIDQMNDKRIRNEHARNEILRVGRHRAWKVHVPEAEARRAFGRLFAAKGGWQSAGGGTNSTSYGKKSWKYVSATYYNDETGDRAEIAYDTRAAPERVVTTIKVEVYQTKASLQAWALAKRWARRLGL